GTRRRIQGRAGTSLRGDRFGRRRLHHTSTSSHKARCTHSAGPAKVRREDTAPNHRITAGPAGEAAESGRRIGPEGAYGGWIGGGGRRRRRDCSDRPGRRVCARPGAPPGGGDSPHGGGVRLGGRRRRDVYP